MTLGQLNQKGGAKNWHLLFDLRSCISQDVQTTIPF
jgi:hypothetical protein